MNWRLIFQLSYFGLGMAIATVFWIPFSVEPIFWFIIFVICAYLIAKKCSGKYFFHGLFVSIVNSVWITSAHVLLFETYMANHPEMGQMNVDMPLADQPRLMMAIMGPLIGIASGIVLGAFSYIASKIIKK